MNKNFFYNAALVFGIAASGTSLAADPSQMTQQERDAYRTQKQSEMAGMSQEQRTEMRASQGQSSGQGQGTMVRDGSGSGGQYGQGGGQGGGRGRSR
ncbi:MAG: hypothetical protein Q8O37_07345 [Sulfuricellaceae bacterium]|nr:hypothetical protein [Sulfuricellaceae bacterium]